MVTFAPNLPETPDYPYQSDQSRSIQEPRPNTSKEVALKGLGTAIEGGVGVAKDYAEGGIRNELHAGLDTINDQALARLNAAKVNPSLITEEDPSNKLPAGLDNLDHKLDTLDMARKGDKYSMTYIDMQRDVLLKGVRANHPGFRDYIDDTNAKYTREDPANKYITSLIGDINSFKTAQNEKKTKAESQIWHGINSGWDGGKEKLDAYHAGKLGKDPESAIAEWTLKHTKADYDRKKAIDEMAIDKENISKVRTRGEEFAVDEAGRQTTNALDKIYLGSGVKAMDYPQQVLSGEAQKLSPAQLEQIGDGVLQHKNIAFQSFSKWANTPQEKLDGKSIAQVVNPTRLNEIWKEQSQRFEDTAAMFKDKNFGLAYEAHRITDKLEEGTEHSLASNPNIGQIFLNAKAVSKYPGMAAMLGVSTLENPDRLKAVKDYFNTDALAAASTVNPLQPDGKPFTLNKGIDGATRDLKKPGDVAAYAKGTLDLVDFISNPKVEDEPKRALAKFAFDPSNAGLLDKFSKDNQADVYQRLYSYGNIKEMHKLGQQDVQLWNNFKTTAYNHFGSSLLHTQLMDLNEIKPNPNLSISWDTEQHQFGVHQWPKSKSKYSTQENALIEQDYMKARKSIDAINVGLKSISNISKIEHRDANVDALQFMLSAGVSEGSLPAGLLQAIKSSKKRPNFEGPDE